MIYNEQESIIKGADPCKQLVDCRGPDPLPAGTISRLLGKGLNVSYSTLTTLYPQDYSAGMGL